MTDAMKERAAKVAESYCDYARGQSSYDEGRSDAAAMIASAIRALPDEAAPTASVTVTEEDGELVHHLRGFAEAYPESVFTPLSDADTDRIIGCGVNAPIDRISASMGRHFAPWLTKAADRIEALESALRALPDEAALRPDSPCAALEQEIARLIADNKRLREALEGIDQTMLIRLIPTEARC